VQFVARPRPPVGGSRLLPGLPDHRPLSDRDHDPRLIAATYREPGQRSPTRRAFQKEHAMAMTVDRPDAAVAAPVQIADPGPLGLSAFALTTFVLSAVNAGVIAPGVKSVVLALALFYGGAVQVIAGIWEFRKNNTFGATAFCSYGAFWLAYWGLSVFFKPAAGTSANAVDDALGYFLLAWTALTAVLLVAALRTNGALISTFVALTVTFVLLVLGHFGHSESLVKLGGWLGMVTAALALYTAAAGVVNETWRRAVLPVWKV
jgi:uncharacterized protein